MALSKKRGTFTPTDPHREASGKAGGGSSVCVKLLDGTVLTYGLVDVSPATEYSSRCQQLIRLEQVQVIYVNTFACLHFALWLWTLLLGIEDIALYCGRNYM